MTSEAFAYNRVNVDGLSRSRGGTGLLFGKRARRREPDPEEPHGFVSFDTEKGWGVCSCGDAKISPYAMTYYHGKGR